MNNIDGHTPSTDCGSPPPRPQLSIAVLSTPNGDGAVLPSTVVGTLLSSRASARCSPPRSSARCSPPRSSVRCLPPRTLLHDSSSSYLGSTYKVFFEKPPLLLPLPLLPLPCLLLFARSHNTTRNCNPPPPPLLIASVLKAVLRYRKKQFAVDETRRDTYNCPVPSRNEPQY
ncbi:hypothetical protein HN51_031143 [Arachis hypogaea]|nr:uncharacterized protein DS421_10g297350 [Arachis hypogaea]